MLNAVTWLVWAVVVLVVASATRNPLYILEIIAVLAVVDSATQRSDDGEMLFSATRFAMIAVPAAAIFNALTVHLGATVIFRLPSWLPLLGGIVTLEGAAYGALNGLLLTIIFFGFNIMSRRTHTQDLVRLVPRAFHQIGVVLAIAMTYLPQTRQNLDRIKEAQIIRGAHLRSVRDWAPIVVPLLVGGLERSMGLSEAMVARGYANQDGAGSSRWQQLGLVAAMVMLLVGWVAQLWTGGLAYVALMVAGGLLFVLLVWNRGRSEKTTRYKRGNLAWQDWLCLAGCVVALMIVVFLPTASPSLAYSPYPALSLPPFSVWIGFSLLGLALPGLVSSVPQDGGGEA